MCKLSQLRNADNGPSDRSVGDIVTSFGPPLGESRLVTSAGGTLRARESSVRRLTRNVRSSLGWAGGESVVNVLAALSTTLLVGRMIGPVEFGVAAIAYLFGSLAEAIVATPFVDPLIMRRRLDMSMVDAAFTAMVALGVGVYLLILASAPLLAGFYKTPALSALLAVQGTTCLLLGLRGTLEAIMARKLRFKALAIRNIVAKIASALVSLVAALFGMGAWSIILGNVAFAAGSTVMIFSMSRRLPRIVFLPGHVAGLVSLGVFSLLDALTWTAIPRLFSFLVGYFHGMRVLGELNIAMRMNDTVCALIGAASTRLALPMLSRVAEDRQRLERSFLEGSRILCLIVGPIFLGLAFTSHELIALALGPNWNLASSALVAVCLFSLFNFVLLLAHPTVKAVSRPDLLIFPNVIGLIYIAAGSLLVRHFGFRAQLALWVSFGAVFLMCSLRMVWKAIGTNWWIQLKPLSSAAVPSIGMCSVLYGVALLNPTEVGAGDASAQGGGRRISLCRAAGFARASLVGADSGPIRSVATAADLLAHPRSPKGRGGPATATRAHVALT